MGKRKYRVEDDPRFQNRKGPSGELLDPSEAGAYFPSLDLCADPMLPMVGMDVVARIKGKRFLLRNVTASAEEGWFFGTVEWPDDGSSGSVRYEHLESDQCIGFTVGNVFDIQVNFDLGIPESDPKAQRELLRMIQNSSRLAMAKLETGEEGSLADTELGEKLMLCTACVTYGIVWSPTEIQLRMGLRDGKETLELYDFVLSLAKKLAN